MSDLLNNLREEVFRVNKSSASEFCELRRSVAASAILELLDYHDRKVAEAKRFLECADAIRAAVIQRIEALRLA